MANLLRSKAKTSKQVMTRIPIKVQELLVNSAVAYVEAGGHGSLSKMQRDAIDTFVENKMVGDQEELVWQMAKNRMLKGEKTNVQMYLGSETLDKIAAFQKKMDKYDITVSDIATEAFFCYCSKLADKTEALKLGLGSL